MLNNLPERESPDNFITRLADRDVTLLDNPGLMYGNAGVGLAYALLHESTQVPQYADKALQYLKAALSQLSNKDFSLASGLTGIAFAIRCFIDLGLLRNDDTQMLKTFDSLISVSLERDIQTGNMDLLFGALGKINYRLLVDEHHKDIKGIHDYFLKTAISRKGRFFWRTQAEEKDEEAPFELGIAHGQSAILYLLSKTRTYSNDPYHIDMIIRSGASGLMSGHLENSESYFSPNTALDRSCRLCWCNGDVGMISALLASYEATGDDSIRKAAFDALQWNATRTIDRGLIKMEGDRVETNLCHGLLSPTLMFRLVSKSFPKENKWQKASDYWMQQLIKQLKHPPLTQYDYASQNWESRPGLLEGDAGVMMFLASCLREDFTILKKILLLDVF